MIVINVVLNCIAKFSSTSQYKWKVAHRKSTHISINYKLLLVVLTLSKSCETSTVRKPGRTWQGSIPPLTGGSRWVGALAPITTDKTCNTNNQIIPSTNMLQQWSPHITSTRSFIIISINTHHTVDNLTTISQLTLCFRHRG
jgi:hypothetical protein